MKVLHLETGTHVYGGALQVLILVEGLEARGVENLLVVPSGSPVESEAVRRGLPVHPVPMAGEADLLFLFRFRRLIQRVAPDLVHLHSRRGADTLGALAAGWSGAPAILTRRVDNPEPSWLLGAKYGLYRRVVAISRAIQDVLIRQGVPSDKIRCVPSALDPAPFQNPCNREDFARSFGLGPEQRVVGMAAQFIPRKGHGVLLEAVPMILRDHPQTRFLLFGQGPLRKAMIRRVGELDLQDVVLFPGFRKDLPGLLPCLDLLVHPATMEGLGIILLQAAAAGLPVVAAGAGGVPEAVVDGTTGLLVPPGDAHALASAVSGLLDDPARASSMGRAGREHVSTAFSVDRMVEGNLSVYQELLVGSASG